MSSVSVAVVVISNIIIVSSYALNLFNVINLSSSESWPKAVSSYGSHIITVAMFYGFCLLAHIKPSSVEYVVQRKFFQ